MTLHIKHKIAGLMVPAALLAFASPALAASVSAGVGVNAGSASLGTKAEVKLSDAQTKAVAKSAAEIDQRVSDLSALSARIDGMTHVSAAVKANIGAAIQSTLSDLSSLKAKIAADTTTADLKTDMDSITGSYRVYALVMPQARILAAVDKAGTIGDMLTALGTKMQARVDAAASAGSDTTAIAIAQADMNAKVADSKLQITAAISYVSALKPDGGDKTVLASNTAALVKARADLRVAESDLKTAVQDSKTAIAALKGFGDVSVSASAAAGTH